MRRTLSLAVFRPAWKVSRAVSAPRRGRIGSGASGLFAHASGFIGHGASRAGGLIRRMAAGVGCFVDLIVSIVAW